MLVLYSSTQESGGSPCPSHSRWTQRLHVCACIQIQFVRPSKLLETWRTMQFMCRTAQAQHSCNVETQSDWMQNFRSHRLLPYRPWTRMLLGLVFGRELEFQAVCGLIPCRNGTHAQACTVYSITICMHSTTAPPS